MIGDIHSDVYDLILPEPNVASNFIHEFVGKLHQTDVLLPSYLVHIDLDELLFLIVDVVEF